MKRGRGRPRGRTAQGEHTRATLYEVAIRQFAVRGYEATTLRAIAREAGVSPGLLYRYFPSKSAVVIALYEALSFEFDALAAEVPAGTWAARVDATLTLSLEVLGPHRDTLRSVLAVMLTDPELGLFSAGGATGRRLVQARFLTAVSEADNAPRTELAATLGRLCDMMHLGVVLWWLLDRSPGQSATTGLVALLRSLGSAAAAALWLPGVASTLHRLDDLIQAALWGTPRALA